VHIPTAERGAISPATSGTRIPRSPTKAFSDHHHRASQGIFLEIVDLLLDHLKFGLDVMAYGVMAGI